MIDRVVGENVTGRAWLELVGGWMKVLSCGGGNGGLRDAVPVRQSIGGAFAIGETLDGKAKSAAREIWSL